MPDDLWIWGIRAAGVFHFVTVALAMRTPIPAGWDGNLARLPEIHRRFAIAQNLAVGAVMVVLGVVCLGFAPELAAGTPLARLWCGAIALWWGGRLALLPWLGITPELTTPVLRLGYRALQVQCAIYGVAFGWIAVR
jgi:hypothetical protein